MIFIYRRNSAGTSASGVTLRFGRSPIYLKFWMLLNI